MAAAVDTKQQSRLAFVDLQPPDPILGNDRHVCVSPSWHCLLQASNEMECRYTQSPMLQKCQSSFQV